MCVCIIHISFISYLYHIQKFIKTWEISLITDLRNIIYLNLTSIKPYYI